MAAKEWHSAKELAGLEGMPGTPQNVKSRAKREEWQSRPRKGRGGGNEYHISNLPTETQASLLVGEPEATPMKAVGTPAAGVDIDSTPAAPFSYDRESLWAAFERKSQKQKDKAQHKLKLLNAVLVMRDNGTGINAAFKAVALQHGESWRTVQGWYHGLSGKPGVKHYNPTDWLAALVPGNVGRTATAELSDDAWEQFKADWLRPEEPTATDCYRRLERTAVVEGWTLPCLRTIERKIERDIPRTIRVLKRQGEEQLMKLFPAQERTVRDMHALQGINGDGYQHNVFVLWPNGDIDRPKTWFWQDVYSRKILSYRVDLTENTDSIRLSFGDLVEQYGIPRHVTIDNTRAAANKWMTGGVKNRYRFKVKEDDPLGLIPMLCGHDAVHWTSVNNGKGHGQAKPIERAFGVGGIGECVDKHPAFSGAYTGTCPTAKPDNYGSTAIPIETFVKILAEEIIEWNARIGRRTEVCGGQISFDQAFKASYETSIITKANEEQRRLWLLSAEAIKVAKDGTFTLDAGKTAGKGRNRYKAIELLDYPGHKVVVRFDPQDLHETVYVYTLDGRFITHAECIDATGFGDTEAARAFNRERKRFIKATKLASKAETAMDVLEVAARLPAATEPSPIESKVVRHLRPSPEAGRPEPKQAPIDPAKQNELIAQFEAEEKRSEVIELGNDPRRLHAYWLRVAERIESGEQATNEEQSGWEIYQNSPAYSSQKKLFEDFGMSAEDFA